MSWIAPITNRTQEDVDLVIQYEKIGYDNFTTEQKVVWNAGMIGALNASDLNRIEGNIQYLANLLGVKGLIVKTNWKMNDICRNSDFRRILDNLESIIFLSFNDLFRNYFPILNNLLVHQLSEYFT